MFAELHADLLSRLTDGGRLSVAECLADLRAARERAAARAESDLYVVRHWDGFDGEWIDVSDPMPKADAEKLAGDKNEARSGAAAGKRTGGYSDIDYYKAFPADTKMMFSDGFSQTRGHA